MVNLTGRVPESLLRDFDARGESVGLKRSEHLREVVLRYVEGPDLAGHEEAIVETRGELDRLRREVAGLKQVVAQVLVAVLMNLPAADGSTMEEAAARKTVLGLLRRAKGGDA